MALLATLLSLLKPAPGPATPYTAIPPTDEHATRIKCLGIEESLLRPSLPPRTTTKLRSLSELPRNYKPPRFRLTAPSFDEREKSDTWFEMLFVDVYAHARHFATRHFGGGDIVPRPGAEGDSLWACGEGFGETFLSYASSVARQDGNAGGWEAVLASRVERTAMVCGMLGRALEEGAWDRLLFGAGEEQGRLLEGLDRGTVRNEGYERTALRTLTINSLLGPAMLPPRFWAEVDTLTTQLLTLLLPLLDTMDAHFPASRTKPLAAIHAELHMLVAEAGYLAVCMRRSNSIFRVVWPTPGDSLSKNHDHDPVCEGVYQKSKRAAQLATRDDAGGVSGEEGRVSSVQEPMPPQNRPRLVAKVKLVLWPALERYRRVLDGEREGVDEVVVRKATVGYYCGRASDEADTAEGNPRLKNYVKTARQRKGHLESGLGRLVTSPPAWTFGVMLVAACVFLAAGLGQQKWQEWRMHQPYSHDRQTGSASYPQAHGEAKVDPSSESVPREVEGWLAWLVRILTYGLSRGTASG